MKLLRKASEDPLPSQIYEDYQPLPIPVNEEGIIQHEHIVERILRAEKFRRGKAWVRRVLVKWKDLAEPNWEDRVNMEEAEALDVFEKRFGDGDGVGESGRARQGPK